MKKIVLTLLVCLVAVALPACKDEDGYLHEMRITESSTNLAVMDKIDSNIKELTNFWSSQWSYIEKPDDYVISQFDSYCKYLKTQIEAFAKKENLSILPDTYVVLTLYRFDSSERVELKTARVDFAQYTAKPEEDKNEK